MYNSRPRWRQLRNGANSLESVIWMYRTRVGRFEVDDSNRRADRPEKELEAAINEWRDHLMAGAGLKSTNINKDFVHSTGSRAEQLQQAHQQLQKQQQQKEQQKQKKQQQQQQQQKNKQLKQQRRLNPARLSGWGRRGWAMLRNSKSKIARQEAPFDQFIPFTDNPEDTDPEDTDPEEPDHSCHSVYRHNQFGITPAPNGWPLHLDDYHSPVKPQEYLKKRVELMRTFYEDRIPSYGHLENVFKLSVLALGIVSALLAQYSLVAFVTIVTALASSFTAWAEFSDKASKIDRYSSAVCSLKKLHTKWHALDEVSKQSKGATKMLVQESEAIFSEEQSSWASSMFVLKPEPDDDADGDGVISPAEAKAAEAKAAAK